MMPAILEDGQTRLQFNEILKFNQINVASYCFGQHTRHMLHFIHWLPLIIRTFTALNSKLNLRNEYNG